MGWVPADGTTYWLSDFVMSSSLDLMYGDGDSKSFTVPSLSSFCKMSTLSSFHSAGFDEVAKHSHSALYDDAAINFSNLNSSNITPKIISLSTVYSENKSTKSNTIRKIHAGGKKAGTVTLTATRELDENSFAESDFTVPADGNEILSSDDGYWETGAYPAYNWLPVFIYVGRSACSAPLTASA